MTRTDKEALERAMKICAEESPGRAEQLRAKLQDETWESVAQFASYCVQRRSLGLRPWEFSPCSAHEGEAGPAADLLRRMLRAGISRYEPDPLRALELKKH